MKKFINIRDKYSFELDQINKKLDKMQNGEITELTKENHHGYLKTNIENLRNSIKEFIDRIEYGSESLGEKIEKVTIKK